MVTQIYTAPLKPIARHAMPITGPAGLSREETQRGSSQEDSYEGQSKTFAATKEQALKGKISINAILSDFQNTMDALGITPDVRQEIAPYLQVVAHQAQKPQPAATLIQQNLRISAETMDQFISRSLGQKSSVVREWVDALLMQPIDFQSSKPIALSVNPFGGETTVATPSAEAPPEAAGSFNKVSAEEQTLIKQYLQEAKTATQEKRIEQAISSYQQVLEKLPEDSHMDIQARVLYQMGKLLQGNEKLEEARSYFEKAHELLKTTPNPHPKLSALVLNQLGTLSRKQGQLKKAFGYYKESLDIAKSHGKQGTIQQTLQQLAALYLEAGKPDKALKTLKALFPSP